MKNCLRTTTIPLLISIILVSSLLASFTVVAQEEMPREETLQMSGYEGPQTALRPWDISGQAGMAFFFMYEPLFCVNVAKGNAPEDLIKILGESIQWVDPLTIEVKIRDQAKWTDGQPITSDDVEYSYGVYGLASETKSWVAQLALPLLDRLDRFEKIDDKTFRWHINSSYPNSLVVWRHVTESYQILPKHIWEQIEAQYGDDMRTFANDWQAADMPEEWKVASGMYLPTFHDDSRVIMTRNDNWWGKDVFGKLPAPKYILHTRYASNSAAVLDFQNDQIDWCGTFIAGIEDIKAEKPEIGTYDPNSPYYAEMSIKLLVPNHRKYPLGEGWLHRAMAMALDYKAISDVSSGYLKAPSPYPSHLLPSDDQVAKRLVKSDIEQQFAIIQGIDGAVGILEEHCIQVDGQWYTKDGPSQEWLDLYGDDALPYSDALPNEPGINVRLGPWSIMDQQGWTDVLAIDAVAVNQLAALNITMSQKVVDWGTNDADGHSFNYDFMHFVMHFATGTMYDRYDQMFVGTDYYWNHYGDYRNPEFTELLRRLDITAGADQQAVADQILTIMGEDMPIIPFGGHPNWYQYNTKYWVGFSNKVDNPILPAGPFGGSGYSGLLQTAVLNLRPAGAEGTVFGISLAWIAAIVIVVVVVIVVLAVVLVRRRSSKK
jgi:peptide/nickel transport system substrate-binding protein